MKRRVTIGYIRVSTCSQAEDGVSLEAQRRKIEAYCSLHDLELSEIVEDAGLSGKSISGRPGMQRILSLVKCGKCDNLVVFKLDRLARNLKEACEISDLLKKKDCDLHSISERIDTGSATGKLFYHILSAMNQWEREVISERTVTALNVKRTKAQRISRFAPYGYRFDNDDNVIEDEEEQAVIKKILELRGNGFTIRQVVEFLEQHGYRNRRGNRFGVREIWEIARKAA